MRHTTITIPPTEHENLIICVAIPDLAEVRAFSDQLHAASQPWAGLFQGWDGEYTPSVPVAPPGSRMTFTPAEFVLGDSRAWFFGRMWEAGDDQPPSESCNGPAAGQAVDTNTLLYA